MDHLFAALHRRAVITFKDDMKLKKGKVISQELFKAIEESQICIVVLSKDYADSTWCLEELAKKFYCNEQEDRNQTVLPVFYDVDPSDVRKQTGSYGEAFARHEERFTYSDKVQRWRKALSKVGNLNGWVVRNKPESQVIEGLVQATTTILSHKFSSLADEYVGIQSRLEILHMHLALELNDVRYIGIVGMGGIGKTTLTNVLYERIYHYFDAFSFLENVNKGFMDEGLINLQEQLLCETLQEHNMKIWSFHTGTKLISTRLRNIKSLIVLDNVDQSYQLEKLVGKPEWFGVGSRIIIITRDMHILKEYGVDHICKVELLNRVEDVLLFSRRAFKRHAPLKDYEGLTYRVLQYANGLPLAIKVLGSFLFGMSVLEWESALARLQENHNKEIIDVLRTSFDGLEITEKDIFLDIACCFQAQSEWSVKDILKNCGYNSDIGIRILINKSLIDIVRGRLWIHDLLQELAKKIVMEKSPKEPGPWSRLWSYEHLHHIMERNTATEDIEVLDLSEPPLKETKLKAHTLSKMSRLRILRLNGIKITGNLAGLSREIQYLSWRNYPDTYLPHPFTRCSGSKQSWKGIKPFNNIMIIIYLDLSYSKNLIKTPDFRGMPNLRWLILKGSTSLTHVDESIRVLSKLKVLILGHCISLVSLPSSIFRLTSLQYLAVSCCSKLKNPFEETNDADCSKEFIDKSTYTSAIVQNAKMSPSQFFARRQKQPSELLSHGLRSLQALHLGYCNLRELHNAIGSMNSLKSLDLSGNKFVTLPSTINKLSRLAQLYLGDCKELHYLPEFPISIETEFLGGESPANHISSAIFDKALYIYNCPMLVENKVQPYTKLALSWLTKLKQEPHRTDARINIVIPGNDVPKWFNHQSLGRSTKVQLPHSSEWIGVALCAALVPTGYGIHYDANVYYDTDFVVELCGTRKTMRITCYPSDLIRTLVKIESDHLWLFYLSREESICRILETWEAGKEVEFRATDKDIKMTKCGVRWVSEQDIRELELLKE